MTRYTQTTHQIVRCGVFSKHATSVPAVQDLNYVYHFQGADALEVDVETAPVVSAGYYPVIVKGGKEAEIRAALAALYR